MQHTKELYEAAKRLSVKGKNPKTELIRRGVNEILAFAEGAKREERIRKAMVAAGLVFCKDLSPNHAIHFAEAASE